jgi:hypothetical protein
VGTSDPFRAWVNAKVVNFTGTTTTISVIVMHRLVGR